MLLVVVVIVVVVELVVVVTLVVFVDFFLFPFFPFFPPFPFFVAVSLVVFSTVVGVCVITCSKLPKLGIPLTPTAGACG